MASPRYLCTERPKIIAKFNTLDTVTVSVYDMAGNLIALAPGDDACSEIATTGIFVWDTALLPGGTISLTDMTKLLFVFDNTGFTVEESIEWGGWPDRLVGLSQENVYIDNTTFHPVYGVLTAARLRIYAEGYALGGAAGVVATYNITAVATGPAEYSSFEMEKV
jgi:hypothetical protein